MIKIEHDDFITEMFYITNIDSYKIDSLINSEKRNQFEDYMLLTFSINPDKLTIIKDYHTSNTTKGTYGIIEIDLSYGNALMKLPNPSSDFNKYLKVKNKIIKHFISKFEKTWKIK